MPWTPKQVRYLESSGSPLTAAQKGKMNKELHENPSLGHHQKGSAAMKKAPFRRTEIEHHDDGSHTVKHFPQPSAMTKSGAFMDRGEPTSYSAGDHGELMSKLTSHLTEKAPKGEMNAKAAAEAPEEVEA